MLTTYLLYCSLFFAGFLAASILRGKRADAATADHLLHRAAERLVAEARPHEGNPPTVAVSQAALDDLRQALAAQRELDAG